VLRYGVIRDGVLRDGVLRDGVTMWGEEGGAVTGVAELVLETRRMGSLPDGSGAVSCACQRSEARCCRLAFKVGSSGMLSGCDLSGCDVPWWDDEVY